MPSPNSESPVELTTRSAALHVSVPDAIYNSWPHARKSAWDRRFFSPERYFYKFPVPGSTRARGPLTLGEHFTFLAALRRLPPPCDWGTFSLLIPGRIGAECRTYFHMLRAAGFVSSGGIVKPLPKYINSKISSLSKTKISVYLRRSLKKFVSKRPPGSVNTWLIRPVQQEGRRFGRVSSLLNTVSNKKEKKVLCQLPLSNEFKKQNRAGSVPTAEIRDDNDDTHSSVGSTSSSIVTEIDLCSDSTSCYNNSTAHRYEKEETSDLSTRCTEADSTEDVFEAEVHHSFTLSKEIVENNMSTIASSCKTGINLHTGSDYMQVDVLFTASQGNHVSAPLCLCETKNEGGSTPTLKVCTGHNEEITSAGREQVKQDSLQGRIHWVAKMLQIFVDDGSCANGTGIERIHWVERCSLLQRFENFIDEVIVAQQQGRIATMEDVDEYYSERIQWFVNQVGELSRRQDSDRFANRRLREVMVM